MQNRYNVSTVYSQRGVSISDPPRVSRPVRTGDTLPSTNQQRYCLWYQLSPNNEIVREQDLWSDEKLEELGSSRIRGQNVTNGLELWHRFDTRSLNSRCQCKCALAEKKKAFI
eukprot:2869723-Rhodomonas_salina.1